MHYSPTFMYNNIFVQFIHFDIYRSNSFIFTAIQ